MLTEETAARIDYGLACIQLAQRLRELPADHPLAIAAQDEEIEPIEDSSPPSITLIAKYGGLSKSTVRRFERLALARAYIAAAAELESIKNQQSTINNQQSTIQTP